MVPDSVGRALTWEYWRRGMYWFVAANIGLALFFTVLLYSTLLSRTGLSYSQLRTELDHGMIAFVFWPPIVLSLAGWASLRRQYVLPVSTYRLVAWSLANGLAASLIMYVTLWLAMNVLYGANWPLWQPVLCALTFYLLSQSLMWWTGRSQLLAVGALSVAMAVGIPLGVEWVLQPLLERHESGAPAFSIAAVAVMLILFPLAYGLAVNGVARDRRGDGWSLQLFGRLWRALRARTAGRASPSAQRIATPRRFRSPHAAQLWAEWRAKGRPTVVVVAVGMVALLFGLTITRATPTDADAAVASVGLMLLMVSPFVGTYLGSDAGGFDRKTFSTTRPLTDRAIAAAVLKNVAFVVGIGALIWLAGMLAAAAIWRNESWRWLQVTWDRGLWHLANVCAGLGIAVLYAWSLCALGASLAMARSWFVASTGLGSLFFFAGFVWSMAFSNWPVYVLAGFCFLATFAVFVTACAQRLVSVWAVIGCLCGHLLFVAAILAWYHLRSHQPSFRDQFLVMGFAALPFAPFAAAPLALSWNRHR